MDTELKHAVLCQLQKGKAHAIPGKLLAKRLQERDTRDIRLAIVDLIETGIPVIGDSAYGYYIAETPEECQECLTRLMSYLKMIARHHKFLLRAYNKQFTKQLIFHL